MIPENVSDLFAFACSDAEGWELLTDGTENPPAAVTASGGTEAWAAARSHVLTAMDGLLNGVLDSVRARAGDDPRFAELRTYAPWSPSTQKNRALTLPFARRQASMNPALEPAWDGATVRLYLSVKAPAGPLASLERRLRAAGWLPRRDGGYLYISDVAIEEGRSFPELTAALLDPIWPTLLAWLDEFVPPDPSR